MSPERAHPKYVFTLITYLNTLEITVFLFDFFFDIVFRYVLW